LKKKFDKSSARDKIILLVFLFIICIFIILILSSVRSGEEKAQDELNETLSRIGENTENNLLE